VSHPEICRARREIRPPRPPRSPQDGRRTPKSAELGVRSSLRGWPGAGLLGTSCPRQPAARPELLAGSALEQPPRFSDRDSAWRCPSAGVRSLPRRWVCTGRPRLRGVKALPASLPPPARRSAKPRGNSAPARCSRPASAVLTPSPTPGSDAAR